MNEKMKEVQRKYREELKKQELEDDKNYIYEGNNHRGTAS